MGARPFRGGSRGRGVVVTVSTAALILGGAVSTGVAQEAGDPGQIGAFSNPFEEGGAEQPRCERTEDDRILCKPTAVSAVALNDGRVLYWNGIEGDENTTFFAANELSPDSRNSRARVLDFEGEAPGFTITDPNDGGASNPNIEEGQDGTQDPLGIAGVPGRPGDGLVGSTVGQVYSNDPSSPPDDPQDNDGDMFCTYQNQLYDGRVISYGGTDWYNEPSVPPGSEDESPMAVGAIELEGLRNSRAFDPDTNTWTQTGHMKYGRWYPAGVTLPSGEVTVFSGVTKLIKNTQLSNVRRTETFDPETNEWQENFEGMASETSLPLYPRLHLMPNGKIFFGSNGQSWTPAGQAADEATWAIQKFWNPETLEWETVGPAALGSRSSAIDVVLTLEPPYDEARYLLAGGVLGPSPGLYVPTPISEEYTVTSDGEVSQEFTGSLNNNRWFSQGVLLPDGQVFAVNGGDVDEVIAPGTEASILQAELYDPGTKTWQPAATMERGRTYHNSAVLLGDGRVLVGGHSPISFNYTHRRDFRNNNDKDPSFQIYSPPYLFRGERPRILHAPAGINYGERFAVPVDSPSEITSVRLVRQMATTHVTANDQRAIELEFTQNGAALDVQGPPDGVTAPPGNYYLFVNRATDDGPVPSTAALMTVGHEGQVRSGGNATIVGYDSAEVASNGSATPLEDTTLRTPGDCPGCAEDGGETDAPEETDSTTTAPNATDTVGTSTSGDRDASSSSDGHDGTEVVTSRAADGASSATGAAEAAARDDASQVSSSGLVGVREASTSDGSDRNADRGVPLGLALLSLAVAGTWLAVESRRSPGSRFARSRAGSD